MSLSLDNTQPDELVQRLRDALIPFQQRPIYLALSGGMDSMLMLHQLSQLADLQPRIIALHINHGLSQHADEWQLLCQRSCNDLNISFIARRVSVTNLGSGIEAAARQARYDAFEQILPPDGVLLLAHHASDQAETVLLRLLRGSGLAGLGSMHVQRALTNKEGEQRLILRPWLDISRSRIDAYAASLNGRWVEDESNQDQAFDRNWLRHSVIPVIKERHPAVESRLCATAQRLQADYELLQQLIQPYVEDAISTCDWPLTGRYRLSLEHLSTYQNSLQAQLVRHWLGLNRCAMPEGEKVWHWLEQCLNASDDRIPTCAYGQVTLQRYRQHVYVVSSQAAQAWQQASETSRLELPLNIPVPWRTGVIEAQAQSAAGYTSTQNQEYEIRPAGQCGGMKVRLPQSPSRTLKNVWQEQGVPPWLREHWPTLVINSKSVIPIGLINTRSLKCEPIALFHLKWRACAIG